MAAKPEPVLLDLSKFLSPKQAVRMIERERGFDDVVKPILMEVVESISGLTLLFAFCQSAITRARGLYEGVVREIHAANHPAVFVLMRQLAETVVVVHYVADQPNYVKALLRPEKDWQPGEPRRKSIQSLIDYMDKTHSTQFKPVYAQLSELTHFGSTSVWNSHVIVDNEQRKAVWSSRPVWRDEHTLYVACAQLLELGSEMELALVALAHAVKEDAADASKKVGDFFDPLLGA